MLTTDVGSPKSGRLTPADRWRSNYVIRLRLTDLLVLVWVVFGVQLVWLGFDSEALGVSGSSGQIAIDYTLISCAIIVGWLAALELYDSRSDRVVGVGSAEYKAITNASIRLFGLLAIVAFIFKIDFARGYILMAFPIGVLVLLFSRWIWRQWLGVKRMRGQYSSTVLLVGSVDSVLHIAALFDAQPQAGYRVVGACVPKFAAGSKLPAHKLRIVSGLEQLDDAIAEMGVDTVVITSSDELSPARVQELSWSLEPGKQHLVVAPSLTGIGGPRIHTRPVAGLPLIHVETPRYGGGKVVAKRALDVLVAFLLITLLFPVLLILAILVRATSPGPVLFRQDRIGIGGRSFQMLKFRSMVADAEAHQEVLHAPNRGNAVLFKMKDDPRVTPIGKLMRRYSLDELPQLFNVLHGAMSLVGPRPPLEKEVAQYEEHVHRRFLVKPGITGLWQVSGRSNLSWEDSVRLDLYYVENWSFVGDIVILWRTARAVVSSEGAY